MSAPWARERRAHPGAADAEPGVAGEAREDRGVAGGELAPEGERRGRQAGDVEDGDVAPRVEGDDPSRPVAAGALDAHPDVVGGGDDVGVGDDPSGGDDPAAAHLGAVAAAGLGPHVDDRAERPHDVGVVDEALVGGGDRAGSARGPGPRRPGGTRRRRARG